MKYVIGPVEINNRSEYGHYEIDTIIGKRPSLSCLVTIIERQTRYLYAFKVPSRKSDIVCAGIINVLSNVKPKSITFDRGKEFALFKHIESKLGCDIYFCDPGKPYQRGSNENTNRYLRWYFPKGTDFDRVTDEEIAVAVFNINNRPVRMFNYKSPRYMLENIILSTNDVHNGNSYGTDKKGRTFNKRAK